MLTITVITSIQFVLNLQISYVFIMDFEHANLLITQTARNENVDLIVMGCGKSSVERLFLGSVSSYVLKNSKCPVAICRH